jgi:cytochrome b
MSEPRRSGLVWDLPVRVMHWTLVLAVAGAWASQKLPGDWFKYHVWCGYTVLVVAVTRIVWGFIGTRHARFANFVKGPAAVVGYARALIRGVGTGVTGHNPLGALMVLALLAMLLAQAVTGLFANDEISNSGPLFGYVSVDRSNALTSLHSTLANILLAAISLHVLAAFAYLFIKRDDLIRPMFTGRRAAGSVPPEELIGSSRSWLALTVAVLVAGALAYLVHRAPAATVGVY